MFAMLPEPSSPKVSPSLLALPLLFGAFRSPDPDLAYAAALASAVAVYDADPEVRNTRRRIALLICELASQFGRRTGDWAAPLPITREELAQVTGLGLCSVKRALALLELTGVVIRDPTSLRIADWPRLVQVAHYPVGRLGFAMPSDDKVVVGDPVTIAPTAHLTTVGGDPAYFE